MAAEKTKEMKKVEKVIVYDVKEFDKTLLRRAVRAVSSEAKLHPIKDLGK